jgi:inositol transporter-like SP family MFS transporter
MWIAAVLATFALGFAVSQWGYLGTQILIGHLVLLAVVTLALRIALTAPRRGRTPVPEHPRVAVSPGRLIGAGVGLPLLLTAVFFLCWNPSALGSYGTYFVVTATGLSQTQATGLVLVTFPPALAMSLISVRLADTVWRDRIFVLAALLQIAAFTVGALTGGVVVAGMVALVALYSLSNVFGGEASTRSGASCCSRPICGQPGSDSPMPWPTRRRRRSC